MEYIGFSPNRHRHCASCDTIIFVYEPTSHDDDVDNKSVVFLYISYADDGDISSQRG